MANHLPNIESGNFDWNDLKYALCVARYGGLSQAARLLGTSASTVARHIQQLEQHLGHALFLRQQSGYLLTDQGKEVLDLIGDVEHALMALERRQGEAEQVSGLVQVASAEMIANFLILPNLPRLLERYPLLQVEINIDIRLVDLSRREADLALRLAGPSEKASEQDYIGHALGKLEFCLFRSRHHPDNGHYVSWGRDWQHLLLVQWLQQHFKGQAPVFSSNSAYAQLRAARMGLGTILLPRFIGQADPDLQEVPLTRAPVCREIWLVYHRDLKASARVQIMREFITEEVRQHLSNFPVA